MATDPQGYNGPLSTQAFYRPFACPSQDYESIRYSQTLSDEGGTYGAQVWMGFIFNAGVLARKVAPWGETPAGHVARVRRPGDVFLFADGNGKGGHIGYSVYPTTSSRDTLSDAAWGGQLDYRRHRTQINVVFVDGHAETLRMVNRPGDVSAPDNAGDLRRVGVTSGVFD